MGMVISGNTMRKPVRIKIRKGERVYLSNPYEGKDRTVVGKVDVSGEFGADSAADFLSSCRPFITKGFSIVMTTGTEYSEYLEKREELECTDRHIQIWEGHFVERIKAHIP